MKGTILILSLALGAGGCSSREWTISGYLGASDTLDSDLHLELPDGTDLKFRDVQWSDESYKSPVF